MPSELYRKRKFSTMTSIHAMLLLFAGVAGVINRVTKPNFILTMTDDQDLLLDSIKRQPSVQKHFSQEGTWFKKHFCTVALCCPSRVSFLTGKAVHNTNVTDVSAPYGGYPRFIEEGFNDNYLPVWLQEAGYNTYYTGKMMNGHSTATYNNPRIKGWNGSDLLIDPGTYLFYNSTMARNHEPSVTYPGTAAAVGFLDDAIAASHRPFFLGVAPIVPHSETITSPRPIRFLPPVPAKRHEVPRTSGFNPIIPGSASYSKTLRQFNVSEIEYNGGWYRKRLQSLQAVDELIDSIMERLEKDPEVLENTCLIYTTDNGFHIGQHRLPPGKSCGIEEDVNIPFFICGPGAAKNSIQTIPSSHTDIVPTLFALAGIPLRDDFDGEPVPVTADLLKTSEKGEHINIEFWGDYLVEGNFFYGQSTFVDNTYKTVQVVGDKYDWSYTVWCTNEHELYDISKDPYQLHNLLSSSQPWNEEINSGTMASLTVRLDALLLTLKRCKGRVCARPWETLHPQGNVKSLKDALHPRFDAFYERKQKKVSFDECIKGQVLSVEGALEPISWQEEWDEWSWGT
ncbi:arylsulfatase precursor [Phaeosphaeriaceae sp. PMI808]|nr:arylsulfatase precursor [Phaeosphaeriaceae sp. PMI808]